MFFPRIINYVKFIALVTISSLLIPFIGDKKDQKIKFLRKARINNFISVLFLICLSAFILLSIFLDMLSSIQTYILMFFMVVFGIFIFLFNKDKLEDIDKITEQEKVEEKRREMEFSVKYQLINKIWVVKWIVKWMYKEGWFYSWALLLIILVGFGLRIWDLGFLSPHQDEYLHLVAAKRFMIEDMFNYERAAFLTYIIGIFFKINDGTSLFLARFPSVIFGTASIVAIYFLARHINKNVGIISAYLIAFSPLCVGMSRFIREYQAYFLFFILFLLYLIHFLEVYGPSKFKKLNENRMKIFFNLFILITPAIYYMFIENVHMIVVIYMAAGIFSGVFIAHKFIKSENKRKCIYNRKTYLIVAIILILIPVFIYYFDWIINISEINKQFRYVKLFFFPEFFSYDNVTLQWFSGFNFSILFTISFFILPLFFFNKNRYFVSYLLIFSIILITFTFFIDRYFAVRYVYYACPFFIIVFSCAAYVLLYVNKIFNNKSYIYLFLVSILLLSFFSPFTVINGLVSEEQGKRDPKTGLVHRNNFELSEYLEKHNFSETEALISANSYIFTYYYDYDFVENESEWPLKRFIYKSEKMNNDYGTLYHYFFKAADSQDPSVVYKTNCRDCVYELDENERINRIIQKYETGWIIIDHDRNIHWNKNGLPLKNFSVGDRMVEYMGNTSGYWGFNVYRWKTI